MPIRTSNAPYGTPSDQAEPSRSTSSDTLSPDAASVTDTVGSKRQPNKLTKSRGSSISNVERPKAVLQKKNPPRLSTEHDSTKSGEGPFFEQNDTTG